MDPQVVATIGTFDGVHRGHIALFEQLNALSRELNTSSMVVTFSPHPAEVLAPESTPPYLVTECTKLKLIKQYATEHILTLPFSHDMARMSAEDFLRYLRDSHYVRAILLGYDHQFGRGANQTFDEYCALGSRLGISIYRASALWDGDSPVSSTRIRQLLSSTQTQEANRLLGRSFEIEGEVIGGMKIGRLIGYPTANISPIDSRVLVPSDGVYAARICVGESTYTGMLYIGKRPTLNGEHRTIEINIFDFSANLYDKLVRLQIEAYIRGDMKLPSLDALRVQIQQDEQQIRRYFQKV